MADPKWRGSTSYPRVPLDAGSVMQWDGAQVWYRTMITSKRRSDHSMSNIHKLVVRPNHPEIPVEFRASTSTVHAVTFLGTISTWEPRDIADRCEPGTLQDVSMQVIQWVIQIRGHFPQLLWESNWQSDSNGNSTSANLGTGLAEWPVAWHSGHASLWPVRGGSDARLCHRWPKIPEF